MKRKCIVLLSVVMMLGLLCGIFIPAAGAASPNPSFYAADSWTQHSTAGTTTAAPAKITFGNSDTDQIWDSWGEWGRLFAYTYETPLTVDNENSVDFKIKIDEFTSDTGMLFLTFDYTAELADPLCMFTDWGDTNTRTESSGQSVLLYVQKAADGKYDFRTCRIFHDMVKWNENPGVLVAPDEEGCFTISYNEISFLIDGSGEQGNIDMRWVFNYAEVAGDGPMRAIDTNVAPYFSVMGLEKSNPLRKDQKMTVEFIGKKNTVEGWTENSTNGSMTADTDGGYTVSHMGFDAIWPAFNEWSQLFSYTKNDPVVYGNVDLNVKIGEMGSDAQQLVFSFDFAETKMNPIFENDTIDGERVTTRPCSGKALLFVLQKSETAGKYRLSTVRTAEDRFIWEEERGKIDVTPDANGNILININGATVTVGEQNYGIEGLYNLNSALDMSISPYFSVFGLEKSLAPVATLEAGFKLEALIDPCLPEAGENPITGELEFANDDWSYWNGEGSEVSFALTEKGYQASGKSTAGSTLAAFAYNQGIDLTKTLKFSFTADKVYPTTATQYNTINFIISSQAKQVLNAPSVWMRISFPTGNPADGGRVGLVVSDFSSGSGDHKGSESLAFEVGEDGEILVTLVNFNNEYRLYVNGVMVSGQLTKVMNKVLDGIKGGEVYLSTCSIFEGMGAGNPPPLPTYTEPVSYTLTSLNGKTLVNKVPDMNVAAAPEKPKDGDVTKDQIKLKWTTPALTASDEGTFSIGGYMVERFDKFYNGSNKDGKADKVFYLTDLTKLELIDTGLESDTKYFYTVYAVEDASDSENIVKLVKFGQVSAKTEKDGQTTDPGTTDPDDEGCGGCGKGDAASAAAILLLCAGVVAVRKFH